MLLGSDEPLFMRQTLFYIPETFFGLPLFGWGLGLALIVAVVIVSHAYQYVKYRKIKDIGSSFALLGIGGVMFVFIVPNLMKPEFGIPIRGYGTLLLLAILAALCLLLHLAKRQGIATEKVYSLALWSVVTGIVGARLFYITQYWRETFLDHTGQMLPLDKLLFSILNFAQGGLVVLGSVLAGALGAFIFMHRNKMPVLRTFDVMAPALMLGIAIGRIGCLLNGCCFGGVTDHSWAITFPADSPAYLHQIMHGQLHPDSLCALPVHPTQIYSSSLALLLCGTLLVLGRLRFYRQRGGLVFASFMILYSAGRFFIETIRTDEDSFLETGLTISQNVSVVVGCAGIALFVYLCRKGVKT